MQTKAYEMFQKIGTITSNIAQLYEKLYELEKKGWKGNQDYLKTVQYLEMSLSLESKYYLEMFSNRVAEQVREIIITDVFDLENAFIYESGDNSFESQMNSLDTQAEVIYPNNNNKYVRIFNKMKEYRNKLQPFSEMEEFDLDSVNPVTVKKYQLLSDHSEEIDAALKREYYEALLLQLDQTDLNLELKNHFLTSDQKESFSNQVLKQKYDLIFLNPILESFMMDHAFMINASDFTFCSSEIAHLIAMPEGFYQYQKEQFINDITEIQLNYLLAIPDEYYQTLDGLSEVYNRLSNLITIVGFASTNTIKKILEHLQDHIDKNPLNASFQNSRYYIEKALFTDSEHYKQKNKSYTK